MIVIPEKGVKMYLSAWSISTKGLRNLLAEALENGLIDAADVVWFGPSGDAVVAASPADLAENYMEYTDQGQVEDHLRPTWGGRREGAGRPAGEGNRLLRIQATDDEYEAILTALKPRERTQALLGAGQKGEDDEHA